jgi:predicted thioesterase
MGGAAPTAGLTAIVELTVGAADTAVALRSGDVAVLATPRLVALVEEATVAAVAPALDAQLTTVGTRVELDHHAPTPVGSTVIATARLVAVDGRRLAFEVVVHDGTEVAAQGRVERVVVDRARFLARVGTAAP